MSRELSLVMAKRISDRIRTFEGLSDCTAEKVQKVHRGEDIGDPFMEVAISRELEEYGSGGTNGR